MRTNRLTTRHFIYPLIFAVLWVLMTGRIEPISFLIGYLIGFIVTWLVMSTLDEQPTYHTKNLPIRILELMGYVIKLNWEIVLSGVDVFLRIINVRPTRSGIVAIPIQDPEDNTIIAGLSAHSITITPGQLVVAFDRENKVLYVHCLDVDSMFPTMEADQNKRMHKLRRISGLD